MCGFVGFIDRGQHDRLAMAALAGSMAQAIAHRGPDDDGVWIDPSHGFAIGSRRLAVQDLSVHGRQPMVSHSGRYVIAYNGELYDAPELRARLAGADPGIAWRGHSDTEALLEACERWGVEQALGNCNGMFAFALWDRHTRTLTLARDRFGEKPLYFGTQGRTLLFGSELKAIARHPSFRGDVNAAAVHAFLRRGHVPGRASIYAGIGKLAPAYTVRAEIDPRSGTYRWLEARPYWSAVETALRCRQHPYESTVDALAAVDTSIDRAVRARMLADVPVGAFLSGGVDSTLVVAHMQAVSAQPVRTFTIAYDEATHDESPHAEEVARLLGTRHETHHVTAADAATVLESLHRTFDEPLADPSVIPTTLVCRAARSAVTVALTGDGGDELFGGYPRYYDGQRAWRFVEALPSSMRRTLARALLAMPAHGWNPLLQSGQRLTAGRAFGGWTGERLHRLAHVLRSTHAREMYATVMRRPQSIAAGTDDDAFAQDAAALEWRDDVSLPEAMMLADTLGIMVDGFLVKVDRASMSTSLETRAPLLDLAVFEAAWRLPVSSRVGAREGKQALRELVGRRVPASIAARPKQGFGIPLGEWLRGPLRDWAESLLGEQALAANGYLDAQRVRHLWSDHLARRHDHEQTLWSALVLQDWLAHHRRVEHAPQATRRDSTPGAPALGFA